MSRSGWFRRLERYPGSEKSSRSAGFGSSSFSNVGLPVWRVPNAICTNGIASFCPALETARKQPFGEELKVAASIHRGFVSSRLR